MNNNRVSKYDVKQGLSLIIPRVFPQYIDEQGMIDTFEQQKLGRVYKVNMIHMNSESRRRGHPMYKAIVYFSAWYDNVIAYNFQQRIFNQGDARVVYDDPWFWKVTASKWKADQNRNPTVKLDTDNEKKNVDAMSGFLEKLSISSNEDNRPYRERRIGPVYVSQDMEQGILERKEDPRPYRERRIDPV